MEQDTLDSLTAALGLAGAGMKQPGAVAPFNAFRVSPMLRAIENSSRLHPS